MGVLGLTGLFTEKHGDLWAVERIERLVVDAIAFTLELYKEHCHMHLGCDYTLFVDVLKKFLEALQSDGIVATFVFDGSVPAEKMDTKVKREADKMLVAQAMFEPNAHYEGKLPESGPHPTLLGLFAKSVFADMGISHITSDAEADASLAVMAAETGAHVCSTDSDLMLMEGPKGFVHTNNFVKRQVGECSFKVLTVDSVAKTLKLPKSRLPYLASLTGNDVIDSKKLSTFHTKVLALYDQPREGKRLWIVIEAIAQWLRVQPGNVWQTEPSLFHIPEHSWQHSLKQYSQHTGAKEISPDKTSVQSVCWSDTDSQTSPPVWIVRLLRSCPSFPRQLCGMICSGNHLCPPLIEALRDDDTKKGSAWAQSQLIRAAVAQALGLTDFTDWSCSLQKAEGPNCDITSEVQYCGQRLSVQSFKRLLPQLPAESCAALQDPNGPEQGDLMDYFFAVLQWKEVPIANMPLVPGRLVQLGTLHFWTTSYQSQWGCPPSWSELAAFIMLMVASPKQRTAEVHRVSLARDNTPDKQEARVLAGFEGCLLSALELHCALGLPCGAVDCDYLFDPPFWHVLATAAHVYPSRILGTDNTKVFDAVLRFVLTSLKDHMKRELRGTAHLRADGSWKFTAPKPSGSGGKAVGKTISSPAKAPVAKHAASTAEDAKVSASRRKQIEKKLRQILDLESSGKELNAQEQQKVAQKDAFEAELAALDHGTELEQDVLALWGVQVG